MFCLKEKTDGLSYAAYKICIPYAALVQIIADMSDICSNTLYLRMKYPPQVRVLKWPGDVRSNGCSSNALADCLYLRVTLPKKSEEGHEVSYLTSCYFCRLSLKTLLAGTQKTLNRHTDTQTDTQTHADTHTNTDIHTQTHRHKHPLQTHNDIHTDKNTDTLPHRHTQ
ncbi:unnamed protein product [Haemonchus placei]|uniref:PIH1_CS domain-containing protein n=1 Tax=Haemonchus placei TaxID=6290 RepID=A0A158QQ53_HAEPC|nr:unnamed protein product [Haemonchus placei]